MDLSKFPPHVALALTQFAEAKAKGLVEKAFEDGKRAGREEVLSGLNALRAFLPQPPATFANQLAAVQAPVMLSQPADPPVQMYRSGPSGPESSESGDESEDGEFDLDALVEQLSGEDDPQTRQQLLVLMYSAVVEAYQAKGEDPEPVLAKLRELAGDGGVEAAVSDEPVWMAWQAAQTKSGKTKAEWDGEGGLKRKPLYGPAAERALRTQESRGHSSYEANRRKGVARERRDDLVAKLDSGELFDEQDWEDFSGHLQSLPGKEVAALRKKVMESLMVSTRKGVLRRGKTAAEMRQNMTQGVSRLIQHAIEQAELPDPSPSAKRGHISHLVAKFGGLRPKDDEFARQFGMHPDEAVKNGLIPRSAVSKNGRRFTDMAEEFRTEGHIYPSEGQTDEEALYEAISGGRRSAQYDTSAEQEEKNARLSVRDRLLALREKRKPKVDEVEGVADNAPEADAGPDPDEYADYLAATEEDDAGGETDAQADDEGISVPEQPVEETLADKTRRQSDAVLNHIKSGHEMAVVTNRRQYKLTEKNVKVDRDGQLRVLTGHRGGKPQYDIALPHTVFINTDQGYKPFSQVVRPEGGSATETPQTTDYSTKQYEQTQADYVAGFDPSERADAVGYHRQEVENALQRGDQVPAAVLADYPDLAANQITAEPTATATEEPVEKSVDQMTPAEQQAELDRLIAEQTAEMDGERPRKKKKRPAQASPETPPAPAKSVEATPPADPVPARTVEAPSPEDAETDDEFEARLKRELAERRSNFKQRREQLLADPKFQPPEELAPKSEKVIDRPKDRPMTEAELERQARDRIDANQPQEGEDGPTAADLNATEGEADAAVQDASGEYTDPTKPAKPVVGQTGKTATEQTAEEKDRRIKAMQARIAQGQGVGGETLTDEDRTELADTDAEDEIAAQPVVKKAGRKRLADNTSAPFANRLTTNKGGGRELAQKAAKVLTARGVVPPVPKSVRDAFANAPDRDKLDALWDQHVRQLADAGGKTKG